VGQHIDVELILSGCAILTEALAYFPVHKPYRMLNEVHPGVEDSVQCTMEIRVHPQVILAVAVAVEVSAEAAIVEGT